MAMDPKTREELEELVATLRGGRDKIRAVTLRENLIAIIRAVLNIEDDAGENDGFPQISDGEIDEGLVKDASPVGRYLEDNGTWGDPSGKATLFVNAAINAVLDGNLYTHFIYNGIPPANWDTMTIAAVDSLIRRRKFEVINLSSNTLTLGYPGATNNIINLQNSVTPTSTASIPAGESRHILVTSSHIIVY